MDFVPAPLKGKVAVVTGGSRGIGAAVAETLARQGCSHVAITYLSNRKAADEVLGRIAELSSGIKTYAFVLNVCDPRAGEVTVEESLRGLGVDHIDIVVCSAAVASLDQFQMVKEMTVDNFTQIMVANAWTPFATTRAVAKAMPPGGRVIFLSSAASRSPLAGPFMAYAASKAAMETIARNMSCHFIAQKNGITVNSISIGPVSTDAMQTAMKQSGPDFQKMVEESTLLKRIGEPQEIAEIVAFIASPGSSYIVGNLVPANGGVLSSLQS